MTVALRQHGLRRVYEFHRRTYLFARPRNILNVSGSSENLVTRICGQPDTVDRRTIVLADKQLNIREEFITNLRAHYMRDPPI
jgi:hypothetical protein